MRHFPALTVVCLAAGAALLTPPAVASTTTLIMEGTITMIDGSAPPKQAGVERVCSDAASQAGPLADKQGHYVWRQELDPMSQRACFIRATLAGFTSSRFEMNSLPLSAFTGSGVLNIPTLVLSPRDSGELTAIFFPMDSEVPGKASKPWKAAREAVDSDKIPEAITHFQEVVAAAPKFADAWNILGALYEQQHIYDKARDALQHAIGLNPKLLSAYVRMARVSDESFDWENAAKAADTVLKYDKRFYPEIYLHQAIARLGLKDLDGAESSINTAISLDAAHKMPRAEYVLGRILQAKGDINGAKEHIAKYLQIDPGVQDSSQIKVLLDYLGKPGAPALDTGLERPF